MLTPDEAAELKALANAAVTTATAAVRAGRSANELGGDASRAWRALTDRLAALTEK